MFFFLLSELSFTFCLFILFLLPAVTHVLYSSRLWVSTAGRMNKLKVSDINWIITHACLKRKKTDHTDDSERWCGWLFTSWIVNSLQERIFKIEQKNRQMQVSVVKHGRNVELGRAKYYSNYLPKYYGIVPVDYKGIYWVPKTFNYLF